jgi:hypothetical protein
LLGDSLVTFLKQQELLEASFSGSSMLYERKMCDRSSLSYYLLSYFKKLTKYTTLRFCPFYIGVRTLALIIKEEHRVRMFEKRVLKKIFGPRSVDVIGWKKLHNLELYNLLLATYYQNDKVKETEMRRA